MERLGEAAKAGDIDTLYALLQQDWELLERIDKKPFVESPLHIAASAGCTHFALEILRLKPSFGRKLNPHGHSPLLLALHNRKTSTVERLIKYDPELIRVQGREGFTPLHYVADSDDHVDLLAEFLINCPASIKDLNIAGETAVHIAVKNGRIRALQVLLGWLLRTDNKRVLNWKDENGNTALHLAVFTNQPVILRLLVNGKVDKKEKNSRGMTAQDIAMTSVPDNIENQQIRMLLKPTLREKCWSVSTSGNLADFLISRRSIYDEYLVGFNVYLEKGLSGEMRNALLVVAVLIATATYQALLQPPGGISQGDDHNKNGTSIINATTVVNHASTAPEVNHWSQVGNEVGKAVMPKYLFFIFIVVNSIAFAASLGMIFALLPKNRYSMLLYVNLVFMLLGFVCSGFVISPKSRFTFFAIFVACGVFIFIVAIIIKPTWFKRRWRKAYNHRKMARSVFLCKYSKQNSR